jgi:two-component system sensor histidine kinase UhpB
VLADEALATTRSLAWSLRASAAPPDGLAASLRSLAATIQSRTSLSIEIVGEVETRFAVRIEAAVYKIVEEALTNVMRHASARSVTISLGRAGDTLSVVIEDDGEGFEPEHRALTPGSGMGLLCMEERARLLDGTLEIESSPGNGTVVRAALPVPPISAAIRPPEGRR